MQRDFGQFYRLRISCKVPNNLAGSQQSIIFGYSTVVWKFHLEHEHFRFNHFKKSDLYGYVSESQMVFQQPIALLFSKASEGGAACLTSQVGVFIHISFFLEGNADTSCHEIYAALLED